MEEIQYSQKIISFVNKNFFCEYFHKIPETFQNIFKKMLKFQDFPGISRTKVKFQDLPGVWSP